MRTYASCGMSLPLTRVVGVDREVTFDASELRYRFPFGLGPVFKQCAHRRSEQLHSRGRAPLPASCQGPLPTASSPGQSTADHKPHQPQCLLWIKDGVMARPGPHRGTSTGFGIAALLGIMPGKGMPRFALERSDGSGISPLRCNF